MQKLEPGFYKAVWGHYSMNICHDGRRWHGEMFVKPQGKVHKVYDCERTTPEELIEFFGAQLEDRGCVAMVNGEKRRLADFLRFESAEPWL